VNPQVNREITNTGSDSWREDAACRGLLPDLFFPVRGYETAADALAVCDRCPVVEACLEYALVERENEGIFGGTTPKQRRALRRKRKGTLRTRPAVHGTRACYVGGCRRVECVEANRVYQRAWSA